MDVKTERQGIFRTPEGLLVNKDNDGLRAYKAKKAKEKKIYEVEAEVVAIKSDLAEIKELLKQRLFCK
jgi:hypothetical protein